MRIIVQTERGEKFATEEASATPEEISQLTGMIGDVFTSKNGYVKLDLEDGIVFVPLHSIDHLFIEGAV